jgi:beta-glucuronidase
LRERFRFALPVFLLMVAIAAHAATVVDLDGQGWTFRTTLEVESHPVVVPHCWLVENGYEKYIGHALYERDFEAPETGAGKIVRLRFDAIYDVAQVWVNGKHVGTHEGGYSTFEYDITKLLHPGRNHLLIDVDNTPTLTSIPALSTSPAPDGSLYGSSGRASIVGWMPYGGIVRPVSLIVSDEVYFKNVKIDAKPNLQTGTATITVRAQLHNGGSSAKAVTVNGEVAGLKTAFRSLSVRPDSDASVTWTAQLPNAHLWSVRDPYLYDAQLNVPGDEFQAHIGVRSIEVRGTNLLLNGRPVHLFGANRVAEDEKEGLRESDAIIERDMSDMLADNMRMMRIAHYPQAKSVLDFADKHGMLIIPEAGNWNMSAWQMADPGIRALWKRQMQEMMEADWNHPSVIAWSVGNEYESQTKEGIDWTRDMRAFTLGLDSTRLITFASRHTQDAVVKTGADEASQYSDFVSVNIYGGYAKRFDRVHQMYPDKPIFVTEFGHMGEPELHDPQRIADITQAVDAMKERPWMIGGSLWTWNDYRSFFRGTPPDGVRRWGVVNVQREHRDSWPVVQKLFQTELP